MRHHAVILCGTTRTQADADADMTALRGPTRMVRHGQL